jgi:hypothetical protein
VIGWLQSFSILPEANCAPTQLGTIIQNDLRHSEDGEGSANGGSMFKHQAHEWVSPKSSIKRVDNKINDKEIGLAHSFQHRPGKKGTGKKDLGPKHAKNPFLSTMATNFG